MKQNRVEQGPWTNFSSLSSSKAIKLFLNKSDYKFLESVSAVSVDEFLQSRIFKNSNITSLLQVIQIKNRA